MIEMDPNQPMQIRYRDEYDGYWSRSDRMGESSGDLTRTAQQVVKCFGLGGVLDIGSGEGALVAALLRLGVDAHGLDVSSVVVSRCLQKMPGRFTVGSVLSLPFPDNSFGTVVSTDCLEHLSPEDIPRALSEIHRVSGRNVFLSLATVQDRDKHWHLTVEGRAWWETRCFEAGFRKHPAYYQINDYESLNREGRQICILLEKIPAKAIEDYPLESLNESRGLHMDMLRDTGERSDAHVVRYQWASGYIKPGDRVLDAACGLGYGCRIMRHLSDAEQVIGMDGSEKAVNYASKSYSDEPRRIDYRAGLLPEALSTLPDGSFEVIVSFETLEHLEEPKALLREFRRLLTPGGRLIVSVPNNWSDETGKDPNPHHLQVYDWTRLIQELSDEFILDEAFAQTATQCKVSHEGNLWKPKPRSFKRVDLTEAAPADCEWWLMAAMKSPLVSGPRYVERAFHNIARTDHPSIRYSEAYENPWLMHAMVNVTYRLKNDDALEKLALDVMAASSKESNDYAAALCIMAYRVFDRRPEDASAIENVIRQIEAVTTNPPKGPMGLRWKVSLLFIIARLHQALGDLEQAKTMFIECAKLDVREFGIHLATKTTESWFLAGKLACALGDREEARSHWERGVESGSLLLSVSLDDILINRHFPNRFNYGDGVREYALAWDNIARCANGLRLLKREGAIEYSALESSFQTEYRVVTRDLIDNRRRVASLDQELIELREILSERTGRLDEASADLVERTHDLVETRRTLVERTERLEQAVKDLDRLRQDSLSTFRTILKRNLKRIIKRLFG